MRHQPNERWWSPGRSEDYALIATDGACRNNGHANAIAGCGVFWAHESIHNKSFQLRDGVHPTNQRAELTAAVQALKDFKRIFTNGGYRNAGPVYYIVIKTNSSYVVNSITNWIVDWRKHGWFNFNGEPVSNQDLITELDGLCRDIDRDLNVLPCFWQVGRDENKDADRLAKAAIRGSSILESNSGTVVGFVDFLTMSSPLSAEN